MRSTTHYLSISTARADALGSSDLCSADTNSASARAVLMLR